MRLDGKVAIIVGAGQSPGEGIGNGRATAIRFAQEGAKILAVDRDIESARETAALATKVGPECVAFEADGRVLRGPVWPGVTSFGRCRARPG
jgi:NAD(P)-dependent dehydrogenase (short-subunit alcohol dehydrogenase family)